MICRPDHNLRSLKPRGCRRGGRGARVRPFARCAVPVAPRSRDLDDCHWSFAASNADEMRMSCHASRTAARLERRRSVLGSGRQRLQISEVRLHREMPPVQHGRRRPIACGYRRVRLGVPILLRICAFSRRPAHRPSAAWPLARTHPGDRIALRRSGHGPLGHGPVALLTPIGSGRRMVSVDSSIAHGPHRLRRLRSRLHCSRMGARWPRDPRQP